MAESEFLRIEKLIWRADRVEPKSVAEIKDFLKKGDNFKSDTLDKLADSLYVQAARTAEMINDKVKKRPVTAQNAYMNDDQAVEALMALSAEKMKKSLHTFIDNANMTIASLVVQMNDDLSDTKQMKFADSRLKGNTGFVR